jgi:hypothetical protein
MNPDDPRCLVARRLLAVKRQLATFRTIADEVERCLDDLSGSRGTDAVGVQLVEEMTRLGQRALEVAGKAG